jgi:hypothetical protein
MQTELKCRRCGRPVVVNAANYNVLEGMHRVCFHLEYEHGNNDPDEPCDDPGCFWRKATDQRADQPNSRKREG